MSTSGVCSFFIILNIGYLPAKDSQSSELWVTVLLTSFNPRDDQDFQLSLRDYHTDPYSRMQPNYLFIRTSITN